MNLKLAVRNMKRSAKDYSIYIATVTVCVAILFAFLSIAFSSGIAELAENMANFQSSLMVLSVLLMLVFSFLINYAMKFIIKRRKKEFGTYLLLGLERKAISRMFFAENSVLGIGALLIGLPLGSLLFQILSAMIMNLFNTPYRITIELSMPAVLLTLLLFFALYGTTAVKSSRIVSRMKIKDLIYSDRYNETPKLKRPKIWLALYIVSLLVLVLSLALIIKSLTQSGNAAFMMILLAVAGLMAGVYGIYAGLPSLVSIFKGHTLKWRYKGVNLFLAGQLTSKVNSTTKTVAISAVMLMFSLVLLMMGLSMGAAYKSNIEYEAPFDITVAIDADVVSFADVLDFIGTKTAIREYVEYKIYDAQDRDWKDAPILRLSDYNQLRKLIGLEAKTITDNEFIVHSDTWDVRNSIEEKILHKPEIAINGKTLTGNVQPIYTEPFEQYRTNGNQGFILVVPDNACIDLQSHKSRLVVSTVEPAPQTLRNELNQYVRNEWSPELNYSTIQGKITMYVGIKSWSVANSLTALATLSFGAIYISLILFLIVGTILSMQQSTEDTENKYRFSLLKKLGTKESDILRLMKRQIAFYFALPAIVPIIFTICAGVLMDKVFGHFILAKHTILTYTAISLTIFITVYSCYMFLSYTIFKRGMLRKGL